MGASAAFSGYGTTVEIGNASGGTSNTWKTISELKKVEFSGDKVNMDSTTNLTSPDAREEVITTTIDDGDVALDGNFIPDDEGQLELKTARDARSLRDFKVTLPFSLGVFTFNAFVVNFTRPVTFDKAVQLACKLKITGALEFA